MKSYPSGGQPDWLEKFNQRVAKSIFCHERQYLSDWMDGLRGRVANYLLKGFGKT